MGNILDCILDPEVLVYILEFVCESLICDWSSILATTAAWNGPKFLHPRTHPWIFYLLIYPLTYLMVCKAVDAFRKVEVEDNGENLPTRNLVFRWLGDFYHLLSIGLDFSIMSALFSSAEFGGYRVQNGPSQFDRTIFVGSILAGLLRFFYNGYTLVGRRVIRN